MVLIRTSLALLAAAVFAQAGEGFTRFQLDKDFTCEGADAGDIDGDGVIDIVAGPWWFRGPQFTQRTGIFPAKTFSPEQYSNQFFTFVDDIDGDKKPDVLIVGFPGKAGRWYRNPGDGSPNWKESICCPSVETESPTWTDLTGDGQAELVCSNGGKLGWYEPDRAAANQTWTFHALGTAGSGKQYLHGLGVGDVDGDGKKDVLVANGWWRQPESLAGDPVWELQPAKFGGGGAQMYVDDVDGDGLPDVITSLAAHGYGLAWFQQQRAADGKRTFVQHTIIDKPAPDTVSFSQLHAVALFDMDGDGKRDIVTGKRRWAHGSKGDVDPMGTPVLYWFRRTGSGAATRFEPQLIDDASGVGTQVEVRDVNRDGRGDVIVGNKLGCFAFISGAGPAPPSATTSSTTPARTP